MSAGGRQAAGARQGHWQEWGSSQSGVAGQGMNVVPPPSGTVGAGRGMHVPPRGQGSGLFDPGLAPVVQDSHRAARAAPAASPQPSPPNVKSIGTIGGSGMPWWTRTGFFTALEVPPNTYSQSRCTQPACSLRGSGAEGATPSLQQQQVRQGRVNAPRHRLQRLVSFGLRRRQPHAVRSSVLGANQMGLAVKAAGSKQAGTQDGRMQPSN